MEPQAAELKNSYWRGLDVVFRAKISPRTGYDRLKNRNPSQRPAHPTCANQVHQREENN
jgi:hypothetical protein